MIAHRMKRLLGGKSHFSLLALDHGLTNGRTEDSPSLSLAPLLDQCRDQISAIVVTYGVSRAQAKWPHGYSLVLQCFGAPDGISRCQIASVKQAVLLDAAAVSVQLNWSDSALGDRFREICAFTAEAHSVGMPVLFMVNGESQISDLPRTIRICQEMGADMIKVNCSVDKYSRANNNTSAAIREGPPILMAGGAARRNTLALARNAARLGFAGYCIGRNIFQSSDPKSVAAQLENIFSRCNTKRNSK